MVECIVPLVLAVGCVALALGSYSLYRQERTASRDRMLADKELYAAGEAEAGVRRATSHFPAGTLLHEAGIETAPLIWFATVAGAAVVVGALTATLLGQSGAGIGAGCAVVAGMGIRVALLRKSRHAVLDRQLTRILPQISAGVRSSLTLERALRASAGRCEDPLREELVRVLADAAYGTSLTEAFEGMARRTGSPDVKALAAAIRIQQRFGSPIAPVLDMIANHANARLATSRELKTELAGTRLAKWFVAASMPAIFLIMYVTNADFARFYTEEPLGWAVLGIAAVSELFGLIACQRITSLKNVRV